MKAPYLILYAFAGYALAQTLSPPQYTICDADMPHAVGTVVVDLACDDGIDCLVGIYGWRWATGYREDFPQGAPRKASGLWEAQDIDGHCFIDSRDTLGIQDLHGVSRLYVSVRR